MKNPQFPSKSSISIKAWNGYFTRCYLKNHHLGESLSCSLYTGLAICIEMVGSGNVAILPLWAVCHRRLYAQMALLGEHDENWSFHHAFSDIFWIVSHATVPTCHWAVLDPAIETHGVTERARLGRGQARPCCGAKLPRGVAMLGESSWCLFPKKELDSTPLEH